MKEDGVCLEHTSQGHVTDTTDSIIWHFYAPGPCRCTTALYQGLVKLAICSNIQQDTFDRDSETAITVKVTVYHLQIYTNFILEGWSLASTNHHLVQGLS